MRCGRGRSGVLRGWLRLAGVSRLERVAASICRPVLELVRPWAGVPARNAVRWFSCVSAALAGIFSVGLAALIPLGSGADRWRLGASLISAAALSGFAYPLFAHWTWGGGWLASLGKNYGIGAGFLDTGGAGTIHAVGGLAALSIAWILGPRLGKYTIEGMPAAIPGHNAALVLFGCFLAWMGWIGLNCAGPCCTARLRPASGWSR